MDPGGRWTASGVAYWIWNTQPPLHYGDTLWCIRENPWTHVLRRIRVTIGYQMNEKLALGLKVELDIYCHTVLWLVCFDSKLEADWDPCSSGDLGPVFCLHCFDWDLSHQPRVRLKRTKLLLFSICPQTTSVSVMCSHRLMNLNKPLCRKSDQTKKQQEAPLLENSSPLLPFFCVSLWSYFTRD